MENKLSGKDCDVCIFATETQNPANISSQVNTQQVTAKSALVATTANQHRNNP